MIMLEIMLLCQREKVESSSLRSGAALQWTVDPFIHIMRARGELTVPAGFSIRLYKPVESIYVPTVTAKGG